MWADSAFQGQSPDQPGSAGLWPLQLLPQSPAIPHIPGGGRRGHMSKGSRNPQLLAHVPCAISSTFSSLSAAASSPCSSCPWSRRSSSNSFNRLVSARRTACTAGVSSATTSGGVRGEKASCPEGQVSHSFFSSAQFQVCLTLPNSLYLFQRNFL